MPFSASFEHRRNTLNNIELKPGYPYWNANCMSIYGRKAYSARYTLYTSKYLLHKIARGSSESRKENPMKRGFEVCKLEFTENTFHSCNTNRKILNKRRS